MTGAIADRIKVIDADTHVTEPEDLWTSRVSVARWGDLVPHVRFDEKRQTDYWYFGDRRSWTVAGPAMAGWKEFPPSHPPRLQDADPACWDPVERLKRMDEYGIYAQIVYPNVGGFGSGQFLSLKEPELMLECVRAYNDFLVEWASVDPARFALVMALPFWDLEETIREIHRAAGLGHRGLLFTGDPTVFGQPDLADPHWNPVWATAQDLGLTVNFHIASGDTSMLWKEGYRGNGLRANYAKQSVMFFLDNARTISEVLISGLCHRFPNLNFVSVESGVGWAPFLLEALDWQWMNSGCRLEHPEMDLLPSEYFKRQVYACFWFERASTLATIAQIGPDNVLFETDFPHPTSMSPGPASYAQNPRDFVEELLRNSPEETVAKVLHDNAARLYHLA